MRKLFTFNMVTLDGFFEGPNRDISWHNVDAEFNAFAIDQLNQMDLLIFGRITYQLMAAYWPMPPALADDPIVAGLMNSIAKLVISRSLQKTNWENTTLIRGNVAEEITNRKDLPGKDMAVFGSANLISSLIEMNLVDEHRLMMNPLVLGSGTPLFKPTHDRLNLKLLDSRSFSNGNVLLVYRPHRKNTGPLR